MTQEQKAKAYDEALERMKSWVRGEHPECFTEAQMAAEFIFPELKESRDEWIRENLITYFQSYGKNSTALFAGIEIKDIVTWLEKQSELNYSNAIISENEKIKAFLIKTINQVPNDSILWEEIDKASVIAWIEKQGEFLRLQNSWKPSDMELETLRLIAEKDGTCLKGLYEKLKKLK